ncbi:sodium:calcium antiporter [Motiliproteus sediminis]|uniref:sodium:calcium antiporter n=1 Tax=Motiliproteus sediminis TaxID=1468178 RepID=UPI001AEF64AB|nr:sodium:calcium antiporter [Motiliproteus sediminis]
MESIIGGSVTLSLAVFVIAGLTIALCGVTITVRAERLAYSTGLGQAIVGAVFLGAMTSLSGLVTSLTAAYEGHPQLAVSNAVGGIAAQTTFLALADMAYRRANLEHAAASEANLVQGGVLIMLLAVAVLAGHTPDVTWFGLHPISVMLFGAYLLGLKLTSGAHQQPMWYPKQTHETHEEPQRQQRPPRRRLLRLWTEFLLLAVAVAVSGWVLAEASLELVALTGLSEGLVGTLFTATTTSLPEAVIAIAAVRRGALTLAVGDIIGGNTFDVLFLSLSDLFYRQGSIYHAVTHQQSFWLVLSLVMAAVLMLGMLRREKYGVANIGFESALMLLLYLGGVVVLVSS